MKEHVTFERFVRAFKECGRGAQFSKKGLRLLFEHLEELEEDIGEELELDPIGLCCDYTEYTSFWKFQEDNPQFANIDDLSRYTLVLGGGKDEPMIVQNF